MPYKSNITFLKKLSTPQKIQDFLDSLPFNHEKKGETYMSPMRVLRAKTAHCFEGALLAAAALQANGEEPLLMDLYTLPSDTDHVVTLYKRSGYWGAISKTNHAVLRFRDPVYKTVRELAASYFHEYFLNDGEKTLRKYSKPFNLKKWKEDWVNSEEDLVDLVNAINDSPHLPLFPKENLKYVRKAGKLERKAGMIAEWKK